MHSSWLALKRPQPAKAREKSFLLTSSPKSTCDQDHSNRRFRSSTDSKAAENIHLQAKTILRPDCTTHHTIIMQFAKASLALSLVAASGLSGLSAMSPATSEASTRCTAGTYLGRYTLKSNLTNQYLSLIHI